MENHINRRRFLKMGAMGAAVAAGYGCSRLSPLQLERVGPPTARLTGLVEGGARGLHVDPSSGTLTLGGRPFRGVGMDYYDGFIRTVPSLTNAEYGPSNTTYVAGLQVLGEYGIPFVRFAGGPYWPSDWDEYLNDRSVYFASYDAFVETAERAGVGLIPSMFWTYFTVPDIVGESIDHWGDLGSKTIEFMRTYTTELVSRYRNSPAIYGWEFGNEFGLSADLVQNYADNMAPIEPQLGTPTFRTQADYLTHGEVFTAMQDWAELVRRMDPYRMLSSGNAEPRPTEWNQWRKDEFSADYLDTVAEWAYMLAVENDPSPINTISQHTYDATESRFGETLTLEQYLQLSNRVAHESKKPLFIGEFGADDALGHDAAESLFNTMIASLEGADVDLAALWVYDFAGQPTNSVTSTNDRSYQLDALRALNARLRAGAR